MLDAEIRRPFDLPQPAFIGRNQAFFKPVSFEVSLDFRCNLRTLFDPGDGRSRGFEFAEKALGEIVFEGRLDLACMLLDTSSRARGIRRAAVGGPDPGQDLFFRRAHDRLDPRFCHCA